MGYLVKRRLNTSWMLWFTLLSFHLTSAYGRVADYHDEPNLAPPTPENITQTREIERLFLESNMAQPETSRSIRCSAISKPEIEHNAVRNRNLLWKNFNVYMDSSIDNNQRALINAGLHRLSRIVPCIRFGIFERGQWPHGDYVKVTTGGNGCYSIIGKKGREQELNLGQGCWFMDTIIHEFIHALGIHHEQSRPDRDDYVTILKQNILPGMEGNFIRRSNWEVSTFGVPYNTRSIMHYESHAFSKNGQPTILAKNGERVGSQGLQTTDKLKLQRLYNCE